MSPILAIVVFGGAASRQRLFRMKARADSGDFGEERSCKLVKPLFLKCRYWSQTDLTKMPP
jgi:hypothetical protein